MLYVCCHFHLRKDSYPTHCLHGLSLPLLEQPPFWAVLLPFSVEIKQYQSIVSHSPFSHALISNSGRLFILPKAKKDFEQNFHLEAW